MHLTIMGLFMILKCHLCKDTFILTESEFLSEEEEKYAGVLALVHNEDNTGKSITGVTKNTNCRCESCQKPSIFKFSNSSNFSNEQ